MNAFLHCVISFIRTCVDGHFCIKEDKDNFWGWDIAGKIGSLDFNKTTFEFYGIRLST